MRGFCLLLVCVALASEPIVTLEATTNSEINQLSNYEIEILYNPEIVHAVVEVRLDPAMQLQDAAGGLPGTCSIASSVDVDTFVDLSMPYDAANPSSGQCGVGSENNGLTLAPTDAFLVFFSHFFLFRLVPLPNRSRNP